jgi:hypothetical protein
VVRERREWWGRVGGVDGVNGGSRLLIFVPRATHSHDLSLAYPKVRTPGAVAAAPDATLVFG